MVLEFYMVEVSKMYPRGLGSMAQIHLQMTPPKSQNGTIHDNFIVSFDGQGSGSKLSSQDIRPTLDVS